MNAPAAAFYGVFRMGSPTSLPALVSQQTGVQRRALEDALAANIIPSSLKDNVNEILQQLKQAAVKLALEVPEGEERTPAAPLLCTTGHSTAQQSAQLTRYSLHGRELDNQGLSAMIGLYSSSITMPVISAGRSTKRIKR